jgi:hypothetical protein
MAPQRLLPGVSLFPGPGDGWYLAGPGDRLVRLHEGPERLARLARLLAAEEADLTTAEELADLMTAFAEQGLLWSPAAETAIDLTPRSVTVLGCGPLVAAVATLLGGAGVGRVEKLPALQPPAAVPDLVIACAGGLTDAWFLELDDWCLHHRIPWHRTYQDGGSLHLGPLSLPGETAAYRDARERQLALAAHPEVLLALWRHLDATGGGEVPPLAPAVASVAAGLLAADALAVLAGTPPPFHGRAVELDPVRLTWCAHPVLPVPRGLLTEEAP